MPKKIITGRTLPIALAELDRWSGKLTWERFGNHLAQVLGVKSISRHTLLQYPELVEAFRLRKQALREAKEAEVKSKDISLESALKEIDALQSKVERLERQNERLKEQFVRWQYNLYMMPGVDLNRLNQQMDRPLPVINRRE